MNRTTCWIACLACARWRRSRILAQPTNKLAGLDTSSTQAVISVCHRAAPARPYGRARPLSGCILDRCAGQTTAWCPAFAPTRNKRLPTICSVVMARCKSNASWNSTALLLASFRDTLDLQRAVMTGQKLGDRLFRVGANAGHQFIAWPAHRSRMQPLNGRAGPDGRAKVCPMTDRNLSWRLRSVQPSQLVGRLCQNVAGTPARTGEASNQARCSVHRAADAASFN